MSKASIEDIAYFLNKGVRTEQGCLEWAGKTSNGYGHTVYMGFKGTTARIVYQLVFGRIDNKLVVDHLCRNRKCFNVSHLQLVSQKENIARGIGVSSINRSKTHCHKGHPFDKSNTYVYLQKNGITRRQCRKCGIEANRRMKECQK